MSVPIPAFLAPFLWSYDLSRLDLERDKSLIIKQVLDHGSAKATDWLRATYSTDEIRDAIQASARSDWGRKSLELWALVYDTRPAREGRFA